MSYSLEQLLSGKKVVCRNGLVPSLIVYFPSIYNQYYTKGVLIIQAPFGAENTLLYIDAHTGRHNYNPIVSDSDFDLLLSDEPSEVPVITISADKMGFVNLYENDKKSLWGSFIYPSKEEAEQNAAPTRTAIGTVFY